MNLLNDDLGRFGSDAEGEGLRDKGCQERDV